MSNPIFNVEKIHQKHQKICKELKELSDDIAKDILYDPKSKLYLNWIGFSNLQDAYSLYMIIDENQPKRHYDINFGHHSEDLREFLNFQNVKAIYYFPSSKYEGSYFIYEFENNGHNIYYLLPYRDTYVNVSEMIVSTRLEEISRCNFPLEVSVRKSFFETHRSVYPMGIPIKIPPYKEETFNIYQPYDVKKIFKLLNQDKNSRSWSMDGTVQKVNIPAYETYKMLENENWWEKV